MDTATWGWLTSAMTGTSPCSAQRATPGRLKRIEHVDSDGNVPNGSAAGYKESFQFDSAATESNPDMKAAYLKTNLRHWSSTTGTEP